MAYIYLQFIVGLGLIGGYFGYYLVYRQAKGNGKSGFLDNFMAQFGRELVTTIKTVHSRKICIKFIYAGLFEDRYLFFDNIGYDIGMFAVGSRIPFYDNGFRTEFLGHFHRHTGMHPKTSGLVATCGNHPSVANATNKYGPMLQFTVLKSLYGYKKGIQIQMKYCFVHRTPKKGMLNYGIFPIFWIISIIYLKATYHWTNIKNTVKVILFKWGNYITLKKIVYN